MPQRSKIPQRKRKRENGKQPDYRTSQDVVTGPQPWEHHPDPLSSQVAVARPQPRRQSACLLDLPAEIILLIAAACNDKDLAALTKSHGRFDAVVNDPQTRRGIFHKRFSETFDVKYFDENIQGFREAYKDRFGCILPVRIPHIRSPCYNPMSRKTIRVLLQVIKECDPSGPMFHSKNLLYLRATCTQFPAQVWMDSGTQLHADILQLCLFHLVLEVNTQIRFPDLRNVLPVAFGNPLNFPLFSYTTTQQTVLIPPTAIRILDFFKHQMLCVPASELVSTLNNAAPIDRPQPWHHPFPSENAVRPLGSMWKSWHGICSDPNENNVVPLRQKRDADTASALFHHLQPIEDLGEIFLSFEADLQAATDFPNFIIQDLNPYGTCPPMRRSQIRSKHGIPDQHRPFVGLMEHNGWPYLLAGAIKPVFDSGGVRGWQRIAFVAYYTEGHDTTPNEVLDELLARRGDLPAGGHVTVSKAVDTEALRYRNPKNLRPELPYRRALSGRGVGVMEAFCDDLENYRINNARRTRYQRVIDESKNLTDPDDKHFWATKNYERPNLLNALQSFDENLYCYEGLVLPGLNAVLGRWWRWDETESQEGVHCVDPIQWRKVTGPFCMWNVDLGYMIPRT